MTFSRRDQLMVQYSARSCTLDDRQKDEFEKDLVPLARAVEGFPTAALHAEIEHAQRTGDWIVKLDLVLSRGLDLFASATDTLPQPAFKRCVRTLIGKVSKFKAVRNARAPVSRGEVPAQKVRAPVAPDLEAMRETAEAGDYTGFHREIAIYRESLRKRVGRRIELDPENADRLLAEFSIDDCVESVFLDAFERFEERPRPPESLGDWLETLIDPMTRRLLENPEEERRNLDFVRSARGD